MAQRLSVTASVFALDTDEHAELLKKGRTGSVTANYSFGSTDVVNASTTSSMREYLFDLSSESPVPPAPTHAKPSSESIARQESNPASPSILGEKDGDWRSRGVAGPRLSPAATSPSPSGGSSVSAVSPATVVPPRRTSSGSLRQSPLGGRRAIDDHNLFATVPPPSTTGSVTLPTLYGSMKASTNVSGILSGRLARGTGLSSVPSAFDLSDNTRAGALDLSGRSLHKSGLAVTPVSTRTISFALSSDSKDSPGIAGSQPLTESGKDEGSSPLAGRRPSAAGVRHGGTWRPSSGVPQPPEGPSGAYSSASIFSRSPSSSGCGLRADGAEPSSSVTRLSTPTAATVRNLAPHSPARAAELQELTTPLATCAGSSTSMRSFGTLEVEANMLLDSSDTFVASRHGRRSSRPPEVPTQGGGSLSPGAGGGSGNYGTYFTRAPSSGSAGSYRTISMHSLATRQKKDDNFDFGLDALGIPTGELRSVSSRGSHGGALSQNLSSQNSHASSSSFSHSGNSELAKLKSSQKDYDYGKNDEPSEPAIANTRAGGDGEFSHLRPARESGSSDHGSARDFQYALTPMGSRHRTADLPERHSDGATKRDSGSDAVQLSPDTAPQVSPVLASHETLPPTVSTPLSSFRRAPVGTGAYTNAFRDSFLRRTANTTARSPAPSPRSLTAPTSAAASPLLEAAIPASFTMRRITVPSPAGTHVRVATQGVEVPRTQAKASDRSDKSKAREGTKKAPAVSSATADTTEQLHDAGATAASALHRSTTLLARRVEGQFDVWDGAGAAGTLTSEYPSFGNFVPNPPALPSTRKESADNDVRRSDRGLTTQTSASSGLAPQSSTPSAAVPASAAESSVLSVAQSDDDVNGDDVGVKEADTDTGGTSDSSERYAAAEQLSAGAASDDSGYSSSTSSSESKSISTTLRPSFAQSVSPQSSSTTQSVTGTTLTNVSAYFPLVSSSVSNGPSPNVAVSSALWPSLDASVNNYNGGVYWGSGGGGGSPFASSRRTADLLQPTHASGVDSSVSRLASSIPLLGSLYLNGSRAAGPFVQHPSGHLMETSAQQRSARGLTSGSARTFDERTNSERSVMSFLQHDPPSMRRGPASKTAKPSPSVAQPQVYRDADGRVLEGVVYWSRPPSTPTDAFHCKPRSGSKTTTEPVQSSSSESARGLVLLEKKDPLPLPSAPRGKNGAAAVRGDLPASPSTEGAAKRHVSFLAKDAAVSVDGHQVFVRVGDLQGSCAADECVCRTQRSSELPSDLLKAVRNRFCNMGENVLVLLMDRLKAGASEQPKTPEPTFEGGGPAATVAGPTSLPSPPCVDDQDRLPFAMLRTVAAGVLRELVPAIENEGATASAQLSSASTTTVDLRLALAYLPGVNASSPLSDGQSADAGGDGVKSAPELTFVDLIASGANADSTPADPQKLEVASSPLFGPCVNGCQWLLMESEGDLSMAVKDACERLQKEAASTTSSRPEKDGIVLAQFLLQRRLKDDIVVSSFTIASTADAALVEGILDQRTDSPWQLFRNALGKGPCTLLVAAGLHEDDMEAAYPLAIMQRMLRTSHPPAQKGSVATYVKSLEKRREELERMRSQVAATGADAKRFTVRLEKVRANMEDAVGFLKHPDEVNVPVYVDVVVSAKDTQRRGEDGGVDAAATPSVSPTSASDRRKGNAANGGQASEGAGDSHSTPHRLDISPAATAAFVYRGDPSKASTSSARSLVKTVSSDMLVLRGSGGSVPETEFCFNEVVQVGPEAAKEQTPLDFVRSSSALRRLDSEFRNGFNCFGVFVGAPDSGDTSRSNGASSWTVTAQLVTGALQGVFATLASQRQKEEQGTAAVAGSAAEELKERGRILRVSASMCAMRGDTVVDLFSFAEDESVAMQPFALVLARSPLLGLSPSGVMQRNILNEDQFSQMLAVGKRRLNRLPASSENGTAQYVCLLSLQLKQQDPLTGDIVVSALEALSLGGRHGLVADCVANSRAMLPSTHGMRRRQRKTAGDASSENEAQLRTLVTDAVKGSGHCLCGAVVRDTPEPLDAAHVREVQSMLRTLCDMAERAVSRRVQQGSVGRLLLRLRRLRAKMSRGRDREKSRRNVERVGRIMYDAEQLLYHPDEHEPKYYNRHTNGGSDWTGDSVDESSAPDPNASVPPPPTSPPPACFAPGSAQGRTADGSTMVAVDPDDVDGAFPATPHGTEDSADKAGTDPSTQPCSSSAFTSQSGRNVPCAPARSNSTGRGASPSSTGAAAAGQPGVAGGTGALSTSYYYGLHYNRDPPLFMPPRKVRTMRNRGGATVRRSSQMCAPALVVVSAAAAGDCGAPAGACTGAAVDSSSGTEYVVNVKGSCRVDVCRRSTDASGCATTGPMESFYEADEVVEIRAVFSSIKSVTLARTLSCVVSGRTASIVAVDTDAALSSASVSWLLVRTAVTALFGSLQDTRRPFAVSLRAVFFPDGAARAIDLLRPTVESQPAKLLTAARDGLGGGTAPLAAEHSGSRHSTGTHDTLSNSMSVNSSPTSSEDAPFLSRCRFSPLCGPTYVSATAAPVAAPQQFDTLLGEALAFGSAFQSAAHAKDGRCDASGTVVLQLAVHQSVPLHGDLLLSSLWCVVNPPAENCAATPLTTTFLPYVLGGPCYTTAVLALSHAPQPHEVPVLGVAMRRLRSVPLARPRLGSIAAYESFLERVIAGRAEGGTGEKPSAKAEGANTSTSSRSDEDKRTTAPRLTALINEARSLRGRALTESGAARKALGLLAHDEKYFRSFDD